MGSWRTTTAGLTMIGFGVLLLIVAWLTGKGTTESMGVAAGLIAGGVGLINARDNTVTSTQLKAEKTAKKEPEK